MATGERDMIELAERLGPAQRRVILALGEDWGKSPCHQTAKRMWYGVTGRGVKRLRGPLYIIEHKHRTDNCWRLNDTGLALQAALRSTITSETEEG
jgi:hypothetical protein